MDRRTFLQYGMLLAGMPALVSCGKSVPETRAYQYALHFPNSTYARKTERMAVKESTKCIVHIRQQHGIEPGVFAQHVKPRLNDPVKKAEWQATYRNINACQKDIAGLLRSAANTYAGDVTFFAEGGKGQVSRQEAAEVYASKIQALDKSGLIEFPILERINEYQQLATRMVSLEDRARFQELDALLDSIRYVPGADLLLAKDGIISLMGAETEEGAKMAKAEIWNSPNPLNPPAEVLQKIKTLRDTGLLGIITSSSSVMNLVTLGASHDLAAAVTEWNRHHGPCFSIVTVTPNACTR